MKKILFLSKDIFFHGGAEKSLFDLMTNPKIKPHLIVSAQGNIAAAATKLAIPVYIINFGRIHNIKRPLKIFHIIISLRDIITTAYKIKQIAKSQSIDILHSNDLKTHGIACFTKLLGGPPICAHFRSIPHTSLEKIYWLIIRTLANKIILVSRPCWFGKKLPSNAKIIYNGIKITTPSTRKPKIPFTLGFIGRISPDKNIETLIDWFAHATKHIPNIQLIIRGQAADHQQTYQNKLHQQINNLGLEKKCTFQGYKTGLKQIYHNIDINIVPSITPDPLPRSIMEACSLGIPVIAYPSGGIPYMIEDKVSGYLINNKYDFTHTISQLIHNPKLYSRISNNAYHTASNKFSLTRLHTEITAELDNI